MKRSPASGPWWWPGGEAHLTGRPGCSGDADVPSRGQAGRTRLGSQARRSPHSACELDQRQRRLLPFPQRSRGRRGPHYRRTRDAVTAGRLRPTCEEPHEAKSRTQGSLSPLTWKLGVTAPPNLPHSRNLHS